VVVWLCKAGDDFLGTRPCGLLSQQNIRVAIVEDYEPLLDALRLEINRSVGMCCVGIFGCSEDLIKVIPKLQPDLVMMDLELPRMDGISATREIKRRWPRVKILIFSASDELQKITEALSAGASGYLVKSEPREKLAEAIRRLHSGRFGFERQRGRMPGAFF